MNFGQELPMAGRAQPDRHAVANNPRLTVIENHLGQILLARLRDRRTPVEEFSRLAVELSKLVIFQSFASMPLSTRPGEAFDGSAIALPVATERLAAVAVLRAGLIFEPAIRSLLPGCPVYQLGLRRNEATLTPEIYADNLPNQSGWADRVVIVDPMLATGGTATASIDRVRRHHSGAIDVLCLVAAPVGIQQTLDHDEGVRITTLTLDSHLNDQGYIVPGLGDAGDRFFGTSL